MRTLTPLLLGAVLLTASCAHSASDSAKTTFQTAGPWRPIVDTRADAVMVYGTGGSEALVWIGTTGMSSAGRAYCSGMT